MEFFWVGKRKFWGGAMASRWGRSQKKRSTQNEELILPPNYGEDQKKGFQFGKPPFSATFAYLIKNNTTLFLSTVKLKDLNEIYLLGG